jgi:hypothetical protein
MPEIRLISLTSPYMHGPDVTELQRAMKVKKYYNDELDGIAGPLTCQGFYRAKYWLGYGKPDQVGGQLLYDYLKQVKPATAAMKARTKARVAKRTKYLTSNQVMTRGENLVKTALAELGTTENPPNSNRCKYSLWYKLIGPWCAMFCSWICDKCGSKFHYAYVPYVLGDARAGRNNLTVTQNPKSGNAACFDWGGDGIPDHIGFYAEAAHLQKYAPSAYATAVREQGKLGSGEFWAVEGNTAYGNDSNGGKVMIRKRSRGSVRGFVVIGG